MELDKIEKLLLKYEEGETTLKEEGLLQEYFSNHEVPQHLESYKLMFSYTAACKSITYTEQIKTTNPRRFFMTGVAASIMLAIGVFGWQNSNVNEISSADLGTVESPEEAYRKTKEALQMVAQAFDTGREELVYLNQIEKTKSKYFNQ